MTSIYKILLLIFANVCLSSTALANTPMINSDYIDVSTDINVVPLNTISPDTLQLFVKSIATIRNDFVDPVNDDSLFIGAIDGMLKSIDPYAEFLDAQSYLNLQNYSDGELADVGLTLIYSKQYESWIVESIANDSPSLGKIIVGDFVHSLNNIKLTKTYSSEDVKQQLQGISGSMLVMNVSSKGRFEREIQLQRTISKDSLTSIVFKDSVAVIHIPVFQENTKEQIIESLVAIEKPIIGLVIDIRNNPGGLLSSAIDVAGLFNSDVAIIKIEQKNHEMTTIKTQGESYLEGIPTVILQNRYSASAAEVLASGLQFNKLSTVVGETSYGKGTIQSIIRLDNDQAIKLTVGRYLQPDGTKINGIGVIPDITFPTIKKVNALDLTSKNMESTVDDRVSFHPDVTMLQTKQQSAVETKDLWLSLATSYLMKSIDNNAALQIVNNQVSEVSRENKELNYSRVFTNNDQTYKPDIHLVTINNTMHNLDGVDNAEQTPNQLNLNTDLVSPITSLAKSKKSEEMSNSINHKGWIFTYLK